MASTENPAIIGTGSVGIRTRSGLRLPKASMASSTIFRPVSRPRRGSSSTWVAPGNLALLDVEMIRV